jgi:hypothetical protein
MQLVDPQFSTLPVHVTIVSHGSTVLAFGYADDFGAALSWCGRAMQLFGEADQVAIARPTLTELPGIGKVPMVIPSEGWTRSLDGWHQATYRDLQRFFERVPEGPRRMSELPPAATMLGPAALPRNDTTGVRPLPPVESEGASVFRDVQRLLGQLEQSPRPRGLRQERHDRPSKGFRAKE